MNKATIGAEVAASHKKTDRNARLFVAVLFVVVLAVQTAFVVLH